MRNLILTLASVCGLCNAASPSWLDLVSPVITPAERKFYLSLQPEARDQFEEDFWTGKPITAEEYFRRVQYIDSSFGSTKPGSGANTDQGRVYLSLGPPNRVTRLPSSRVFVPLDIWYYDSVPGVLNTELRLIFFRKNSIGFPKLYSPVLDTIRALLIPQAGTMGMFGPNDDITEANIRTSLTTGPAEDEVITAAVNVATGIKYSGNDEILGQVSSPERMLSRELRTKVTSRVISTRPKLDIVEAVSHYGGSQIDLGLETKVQHDLNLEILDGPVTVYQHRLHLNFAKTEAVYYTHRLDLLPGSYRAIFTVDGTGYPYVVDVGEQSAASEILRVGRGEDTGSRNTPFEFDGLQYRTDPEGKFAAIMLAQPGTVSWTIRRGSEVIWKSTTEGSEIAVVELPSVALGGGGPLKLEAATANDWRGIDLAANSQSARLPHSTLLSFNANLGPALRYASIGHQWVLRGRLDRASVSLEASLKRGPTREASVELARVDASAGRYDQARERLRALLSSQPNDFEALSVLAYVEAGLQDYPMAADLYRRALAIQDAPALRLALAKLPRQ